MCLEAGLNVEGINAEVAAGQWEFQIFAKGAKRAGDEIWLARYLIERTAEKYDISIDWHPKPLGDTDWNGSGMHANFSNGAMRESGSEDVFNKICEGFGRNIERHISVYGADNDQRLTGKHETHRRPTRIRTRSLLPSSRPRPKRWAKPQAHSAPAKGNEKTPLFAGFFLYQFHVVAANICRKRLSKASDYAMRPDSHSGKHHDIAAQQMRKQPRLADALGAGRHHGRIPKTQAARRAAALC